MMLLRVYSSAAITARAATIVIVMCMGVALLSVRSRAGSARTRSVERSTAYVIDLLPALVRTWKSARRVLDGRWPCDDAVRTRVRCLLGWRERDEVRREAGPSPALSFTEAGAWTTTPSPGTAKAGRRQHRRGVPAGTPSPKWECWWVHTSARARSTITERTAAANAGRSHTRRNADHSVRTAASTAAVQRGRRRLVSASRPCSRFVRLLVAEAEQAAGCCLRPSTRCVGCSGSACARSAGTSSRNPCDPLTTRPLRVVHRSRVR